MATQDAPAIGAVSRDGGMTIIAGPCSVESREQMREVAACLKELGITVMRGGEKVLSVLAELFPEAPIYTLLARHGELSAELAARFSCPDWSTTSRNPVKSVQENLPPVKFQARSM